MAVSKTRGTPKWMVKIMENPIKMDDLGGKKPYFWKHPYMFSTFDSSQISLPPWICQARKGFHLDQQHLRDRRALVEDQIFWAFWGESLTQPPSKMVTSAEVHT